MAFCIDLSIRNMYRQIRSVVSVVLSPFRAE